MINKKTQDVNSLQTQLVQGPVSKDPQWLAELEQPKTARIERTVSNNMLRQKLSQAYSEEETLTKAEQLLDSQPSAVTITNQALQLEQSVLKEKLTDKEADNAGFLEEKDWFWEQVAGSVK